MRLLPHARMALAEERALQIGPPSTPNRPAVDLAGGCTNLHGAHRPVGLKHQYDVHGLSCVRTPLAHHLLYSFVLRLQTAKRRKALLFSVILLWIE